jgi:phosphate transport system protein
MARDKYQEQLQTLRGDVAAMGDVAFERYEASVDVLESGDARRGDEIIERDEELNEWYLDIESDCIDLLTRQQPVAGDLRVITASFKIVTDIERIGDLATNLARYGRETGGDLLVDVSTIADTVGEMIADAVDAYTRSETAVARQVVERDETLDSLCKAASEQTLATATQADTTAMETTLEAVSWSLLTIRDLERLGDHAVNICARTLYMLDNDSTHIY